MLNKFMSIFGVGSAKIDLVLDKDEYHVGDGIQGEIRIEGGTVEQSINKIEVDFVIKLTIKDRNITKVISTIPISNAFTIQPGELKMIPFSYELPNDLLLSRRKIAYIFQTKLDIAGGIDSIDFDDIKINPLAQFETIFLAMKSLGFYERPNSGMFDGYYQEFEFTPTTLLQGMVQEVEFIGEMNGEDMHLLLELDVFRNLGFGEKELEREIIFTKSDLESVETVAQKLQANMVEMIDQPLLYCKETYRKYGKGLKGFRKSKKSVVGNFSSSFLDDLLEDVGDDADVDFEVGDLFDIDFDI